MVNSANRDPLQASVLVLNRFYAAVHVVQVRRAVCLLFRELAEVIHLERGGQFSTYDFQTWLTLSELNAEEKSPHDDWIRSVNFELQVPRVIRLLGYEKMPKQSVRFNRRNIFARDGHRCMYCNRRFPPSQLSLDHVLPKSRGGTNDWENVVCSCINCNVRKGGRTPKEARMRLIRQPTRPKRSPLLSLKLSNPKYESWKVFLGPGYAVNGV